jgi:hypothetical protein
MEIQKQNQQITKITSTQELTLCLRDKNILELAEYANGLTISKAKQGTALSVIKKADPGLAYKSVADALTWIQRSLNINNPMSDTQVVDAAVTIVNTYYWLRLEEIIMILHRIKTGKTGKLYHAFDVQVFCTIIEDYLKSEDLAIYHEKEANEFKKIEEKQETSEGLRKVYEKLYEKFKEDAAQLSIEDKELVDNDGKRILVRHADYYNQLLALLPDMTKEEKETLRASYVKMNYKDGIQLIDKYLTETDKRK